MKRLQISDQELIAVLRRMAPETGSLICQGCGHERSCSIHGCAVLLMAVDRLKELVVPPPNPSLTLDELQEMDGEPVWVVSLDGQNVSCWMLVDADYKLCRGAFGGIAVFENNGKTWHAYRRKPEELQEMKEASRTKYVCAVTGAPCC